jgi:hypothetical protein
MPKGVVRYFGIPADYEFSTLVEDLIDVSKRERGALPESLIRASWEAWSREPLPGEQWREIQEE